MTSWCTISCLVIGYHLNLNSSNCRDSFYVKRFWGKLLYSNIQMSKSWCCTIVPNTFIQNCVWVIAVSYITTDSNPHLDDLTTRTPLNRSAMTPLLSFVFIRSSELLGCDTLFKFVFLFVSNRLLSIGGGADEVMLSIISKYMGTLPSTPKKK